MTTLKRFAGILGSVLALAALSQPATAASYVGSLDNPGDVALINFSVAGLLPATVTFRTFSYAGGTNGAGAVIASGGFDPEVTVYTRPAGDFRGWNDDGDDAVPADPWTLQHYDSYLELLLSPGDYFVALSVYPAGPRGSNYFTDGLYTASTFTDVSGFHYLIPGTDRYMDVRDGHWALDITQQGAVPEPASWAMMIVGFGLVGSGLRQRRHAVRTVAKA